MKVKGISKVDLRLQVRDPFIMAANHHDEYPKGNGKMQPVNYLPNWQKGNDFAVDAPWRMYHGEKIPGFPQHPHRGFETISIVPEGLIDHLDGKGSRGRYGKGDVQLMSAGSGTTHSEMFPLVNDDKENTLQLFQVWLNLPAKNKLTDPDYKMLWAESIPAVTVGEKVGHQATLKVILGKYYGVNSLGALKNSWAAAEKNRVGIALIEMDANSEFKLDAVSKTMNRFLFYYKGDSSISVADENLKPSYMMDLNGGEEIVVKSGNSEAKLLLLEGEPINEPVVAYGPFVMNTEQEIRDTFDEYRRTEFGGWKWGDNESDLVNPKDAERFASYNFDRDTEYPPKK